MTGQHIRARRPTAAPGPVVVHGDTACCRWCHQEETVFLLTNNHGSEFGIHWGMCMAQSLTRNHVRYYVEQLTLGTTIPTDKRTGLRLRYVESRGQWLFADGTPVGRESSRHVDYQAKHRLAPDARENARRHLAERIEVAAGYWAPMDDTDWLDHARTVYAESAPLEAPEHHAVQAADQGGLFDIGAAS
ncbi:hypothetical protein [Nocardioides speluncae]|uniref:hypothetical protein n=1 Tax=Nocardioides speluncae TaxID=2670337 RepID=UPI000D69DE3B|nr:hypothetical protein [Nocardioides speluncae]